MILRRVASGLVVAGCAVVLLAGCSAPAPSGGSPTLSQDRWTTPAAPPSPSLTSTVDPNRVVMKDNVFEPKDLVAKAGEPLTLTLVNAGLLLHNFHVATIAGDYNTSAVVSEPQFIEQGKTGTLSWTPPAPGLYKVRCDIHADIMTGAITVN